MRTYNGVSSTTAASRFKNATTSAARIQSTPTTWRVRAANAGELVEHADVVERRRERDRDEHERERRRERMEHVGELRRSTTPVATATTAAATGSTHAATCAWPGERADETDGEQHDREHAHGRLLPVNHTPAINRGRSRVPRRSR